MARIHAAAVSRPQGLLGCLLHRVTTLIILLGTLFWSIVLQKTGLAADSVRRPNIVLILADDKYESSGKKAQNLRENRQNAGLFARFQIAGNYGEFRGITGN